MCMLGLSIVCASSGKEKAERCHVDAVLHGKVSPAYREEEDTPIAMAIRKKRRKSGVILFLNAAILCVGI